MGRDKFTKIEWGDKKGRKTALNTSFGHCDHGRTLDTREEAEVYKELKAEGYTVHKHGWPDFMATRGDEVRLIEVKSTADMKQQSQINVHKGLEKLGVKVEMVVRVNLERELRIFRKPGPIRKPK